MNQAHTFIDFASPEVIRDPFTPLAKLRESDPVHWHEPMHSWCLTRYDDLTTVYRDPRFSAERIQSFVDRHGKPGDDLIMLGECISLWMVFNDPPTHTRLRKLTQNAFTRRALESARPVIERQVLALLETMPADGGDFVQHFGWPLPANVIADLLGVPREHVEDLKTWSDDLGQFVLTSRINPDKYTQAAAALRRMNALFGELVAERRRYPGDSIMDELIAASDAADDSLSAEELIAFCVLLLFAGHETTAHFLASGLRALVMHPDELQKLRNNRNPALVTNACNEILRWDGPIVAISRTVAEKLEFNGRDFRTGERVYLFHGAANRDPRKFADPDTFDIARPDASRMIGFGYGIHLCLGIHLARLEGEIAFPLILRHLRDIHLECDEPDWTDTLVIRGPQALPVSYSLNA